MRHKTFIIIFALGACTVKTPTAETNLTERPGTQIPVVRYKLAPEGVLYGAGVGELVLHRGCLLLHMDSEYFVPIFMPRVVISSINNGERETGLLIDGRAIPFNSSVQVFGGRKAVSESLISGVEPSDTVEKCAKGRNFFELRLR